MSISAQPPPLSPDEPLARFITSDSWVRADQTIKPDAFIPPKDLQLSVTRHLALTSDELWQFGYAVVHAIAEKRSAVLRGRADLGNDVVSGLNLVTEAVPLPDNPHHAHVTHWPIEKPAQKIIAQQLAAAAKYVCRP